MRISVFGLGYVGCVSLGCLAEKGHVVTGVDIQQLKVDLINSGRATIVEKDIDQIIRNAHDAGKVRATTDYFQAVMESDVSFICVGTPGSSNGHLNLDAIFLTARQFGEALKCKSEFHIVVIRSTVLPGTNQRVGAIIGETSGKVLNEDFAVISNPEFLREGTAVSDYFSPAVTVIGGDHQPAIEKIGSLYTDLHAPVEVTDIPTAEMIKYVSNSFHALKITFANEVGNICKALGVDSHKLMELFCQDNQLNISSAYLKPGFAYGGSCLPKDLKGLVTMAHDHYIPTPVLSSISESNDLQKQRAFDLIAKTGKRTVCLVGLSFKEGTDDLRYSPSVELAERLLGKGYSVVIYDKNVHLSKLIGANEAFINEHLPHLSQLITHNLRAALACSEVVLLNHRSFDPSPFAELLADKTVIDMVGIKRLPRVSSYEGVSW